MFSREIRHSQYRAPRSLEQAFGHGAKLDPMPPRGYALRGALWAIAYGVGLGVLFYIVVLVRS